MANDKTHKRLTLHGAVSALRRAQSSAMPTRFSVPGTLEPKLSTPAKSTSKERK